LYSGGSAGTAGSLPESVYHTSADSNLSAGDYERLWAFQGSVQAYKQLGLGRASATVYFRRHRAERFNANQEGDPDAFGVSYNTSLGYAADYRWAHVFNASTALSLRGGVDGEVTRVKIDIFVDSTDFGTGRLLTTQVRSPQWDLAPFLAADLTIGKVTLSAGARYDFVRIPFENLLDPTGDTTASYRRFNPRAGASIELIPGGSVFASWGQTFRAPAVIENACADPETPCPLPFALGDDPPLDPVNASTVEVGFRYGGNRVSLSGSAYYTNVSNDIFLTPSAEDEYRVSTIEGYFVNLARTRRAGVEAEMMYTFPAGHSLYLIRSAEETDGEPVINPFPVENEVMSGRRFPLVPDHLVKFGGLARISPFVVVGTDGRLVGEQYLRGDEANMTAPLDSYFVADARIGVEFGRWEINGLVTNLFQNKSATFGTFNINRGNPDGPTVERFLTPNARRAFTLVVRATI
jgi:outer membrane receptor protein involved in Fe transport